MMRRFAAMIASLIVAIAPTGAPVAAQDAYGDYQARQRNLTRLSLIFGELHHIRRMCEPRREADVWRNRMKKLVDLEEPTAAQRNAMVEAFNKGYRDARRAYASCERAAEDRAAASAAEGERIVEALASALRPADDALAAGPTVTRGRN